MLARCYRLKFLKFFGWKNQKVIQLIEADETNLQDKDRDKIKITSNGI